MASRWRRWGILLALTGCGRAPELSGGEPPPDAPASVSASSCPSTPQPADAPPDVDAAQRTARYWAARPDQVDPETILMATEQIAAHNAAQAELPGAWRDITAPGIADTAWVEASIADRMLYMQTQLASGQFVEAKVGSLAAARAVVAGASAVDHQRWVVEETPLYCVPLTEGLFKAPPDPEFDRNACASLHPFERVRVLRRSGDGRWLHVHAGHTVGWVHDAVLTPRLTREQLDRLEHGAFVVPLHDDVRTDGGQRLRLGAVAPLVSDPALPAPTEGWTILVPDAEHGIAQARVPAEGVVVSHPPLTRGRLLEVAFSTLGQRYGWGGRHGDRDCSRYIRDLLATFGVQLGRHSAVQAQQGAKTVELEGKSDAEKLDAIAQAARDGIVLLYMPGHIMLYLGQVGPQAYAISAISEWLEPCPGGSDTVRRIDEVAVTTLELGRGTQRTAFVERLTRLAVFGDFPAETEPPPTVGRGTP